MEIREPKSFEDLLYLQSVLDNMVAKPRKNNFTPRTREELDILLSIDDEFQEWLKELPKQYNFKTWKQKEYDLEKELEELTDILFFFLQYFNHKKAFTEKMCTSIEIEDINKKMKKMEKIFFHTDVIDCNLRTKIHLFKNYLWSKEVIDGKLFTEYMDLVQYRGFSKEDLLKTYWGKWQKNMQRINGDWSMDHEKN